MVFNKGTAAVWVQRKSLEGDIVPVPGSKILTSAFHPNVPDLLVTAGEDVVLWRIGSDQMEQVRAFGNARGIVQFAAFNSDGERLITLTDDQTVRVWETATGHLLSERGPTTNAHAQ